MNLIKRIINCGLLLRIELDEPFCIASNASILR